MGKMVDFYTIIAYFVFFCDLRKIRDLVSPWFISVYNWFLKRQVRDQQEQIEKANHHTIYLNEDEHGAYMIINELKVYLKAMKAKPLHGFLVGNTYYTTNEEEKLVPVIPRRRF